MKNLLFLFCLCLVITITACTQETAENKPTPSAQERTSNTAPIQAPAPSNETVELTGYVSDSNCGLTHAKEPDRECILKCVENGNHFTLANAEDNIIYKLNTKDQAKLRDLAGKKVKVSGKLDKQNQSLQVSNIEAVS
jgi:hypothetical protein